MQKLKRSLVNVSVLIYLGLANVMIKIMPFGKLVRIISNTENAPNASLTLKMKARIGSIRRAISIVSPHTPWRSMCFEQALTASFFLKLCSISHTIHFGLNNDHNELKAHAWVTVNDDLITGYMVEMNFVGVSEFYYRSNKD